MYTFELGQVVKDLVTGYKGYIRARSEYLTGCSRYGVQTKELKDGKPQEWIWFDEDELVL